MLGILTAARRWFGISNWKRCPHSVEAAGTNGEISSRLVAIQVGESYPWGVPVSGIAYAFPVWL